MRVGGHALLPPILHCLSPQVCGLLWHPGLLAQPAHFAIVELKRPCTPLAAGQ